MLLILGLDGADWSILDALIDAGKLPHLAALNQRSQRGVLRSTIRPESSIAWATFATGVGAGRHGVYSFSTQRPDSYETALVTSASIRHPAFWQTAAAAGKRVALLNVPMTYPPQPLPGGVNVAGMLAPTTRSPFVWPPDLRQPLLKAAPGYTVALDRSGLDLRRFIAASTRSIRARTAAASWLARQGEWEAMVVVYTETDRLQHYGLHLIDPQHPRHNPHETTLGQELVAAYQILDEGIGHLLTLAGSDATVIILSDHGFAACARSFRPNAWLQQEGLLALAAQPAPSPGLWQRLRGHAGLRRLKQSLPIVQDWRRPPSPGAGLAAVDWPATAAVFSSAGGIRFNIRGREPQGILTPAEAETLAAELGHKLLALVDPASGHPVLAAVHRRQDLYHGPYLDLAPDLILEPVRRHADPRRVCLLSYDLGGAVFADSGDLTGNHALEGVFMAAGPEIGPGVLHDAEIVDVAPTLLHLLGLPLPADLDGRVLPIGGASRAVTHTAAGNPSPPPSGAPAFAPDEQAAVEQHLRALGYL
ncbi:MAG: alkaline phosphatase family protein [Caldilineales bacterium]|nr:alkaline phosphatase family protein [Caldilineales bacterium]MCW5858840.1 alkaline phosphatase family protein [Caldilineales bacterium]